MNFNPEGKAIRPMSVPELTDKQIIFDTLCIVSIWIYYHLQLVFKPFRRGFWCDDETIRYPVPNEETVSSGALMWIVIGAPIVVIILGEIALLAWKQSLGLLTDYRSWKQCFSIISCWGMSFLVNGIVTGTLKTSVGRLRPFFFLACRPDVSCDDPINKMKYITDYNCTGENVSEGYIRTSFPSGHSSLSANSYMFLVLYAQKRFGEFPFKYIVTIFQLLVTCIGLYVGISRISDNVHHWSDVLAGYILGYTCSTLVFYGTGRIHDPSDYRQPAPLPPPSLPQLPSPTPLQTSLSMPIEDKPGVAASNIPDQASQSPRMQTVPGLVMK